MASDVQIVNKGLVGIGASTIIALNENSKAARAANAIYTLTRDAVLRDHPWNFAIKRTTLAPDSDAPAFGYTYQYTLPSDFLRVLQWGEEPEDDVEYRLEGGKLLTDDDSGFLVYIYRCTDASLYDALFIEALAARIGAELSVPLAESATLAQTMWALYKEKISAARCVDGQENGQDVLDADLFLNARQ